MKSYIRWFSEIGIVDLPRVGGKNASLGEMFRELTAEGIHVPNGFAPSRLTPIGSFCVKRVSTKSSPTCWRA
jgi:hypothetical protein